MGTLPKPTADKIVQMLDRLVTACEEDFCSDQTEKGDYREPDNEPVAAGIHSRSAITFGMLRDAHTAIDCLHMLHEATYAK